MSEPRGAYLGDENTPYYGGKLLENLLLFGRLCRGLGMQVTANVMPDVAHALSLIEIGRRQDAYHAMRALMVSRQRDLPLFDEAFNLFWQPEANNPVSMDVRSLVEPRRKKRKQFLLPMGSTPDDETEANLPPLDENLIALIPTYSALERLRYKDFAEMTGGELEAVKRLMERLPWSLGERRSRRFVAGEGAQFDLRRAFRRNMRYGGEFLFLPTRQIKIKPRPLVMICDISGSMERYTRVLMQFAHTLANSMYQVESFVFATHLTRVTRLIRRRSVDAALREVGVTVRDWGGGTKIGETLKEFNYRWARRVLGRGAVTLLITDGWDRGDPDVLSEEAERLQLSSYRVIWLNPLLASAGYEPLTRGAAVLLPYVDDFLPIANLANLEMLARLLWQVKWQRPERKRASAGI
jgi:uncharacterized protein with von Willebrand factor type A (vWA) domain